MSNGSAVIVFTERQTDGTDNITTNVRGKTEINMNKYENKIRSDGLLETNHPGLPENIAPNGAQEVTSLL